MLNKTRVITAIWMALLLIPFIFIGGYCFFGLAAVASYIATYELIKMHNHKYELPSFLTVLVPLLSFFLVIVVMIATMVLKTNGVNYVIFGLLVIMIVLLIVPLFYKQVRMSDAFYYIGSIIYGGASFAIIACLRNVNIVSTNNLSVFGMDINLSGLAIFGYVLATTMFTDIGAYEIGCRIGKHKLIPDVSPNKSVEGSIGGSLVGALMGTIELVLVEYFIGFNLFGFDHLGVKIIVTFMLSLLLTVISQIGDLIASKLKREYGIKDYGKVFPGHGGVMDRFDSLILTSAVFYILLALFGVVLC